VKFALDNIGWIVAALVSGGMLLWPKPPRRMPQSRFGEGMKRPVVTFTRGKGTVFNCGSTEWAYGLQGRDMFVERITRNIFDRLSG